MNHSESKMNVKEVVAAKLVVVGYLGVGKTSTVLRYIDKSFNAQIWDTAGQERFKAMVPMFYRNANAALLIFDITKRESFESVKTWVNELKKNIPGKVVMFMVGNKIDLPNRQVSREEALQYAHSIDAIYHECSAKENQGIEQIFDDLARTIVHLSGKQGVTDGPRCEALTANPSDLKATDVGRTEVPSWSIASVAHGVSVQRSGCC